MPFYIDTLILKTFVAVAETSSFSRAGEIVGRSQSAVSLQIKKLEEGLKTSLFERTSRDVALTEQGEIFLGYARRIIELQWEVFSRLTEPEVSGEITLGVPEDFATHYLPDILANFSKHHPHVQLHVVCDLTLKLLEQFKKGGLDIALLKRDPGLVKGGAKVWRESLVWAVAEHYQPKTPLALVLSPQPCIYRARAIAALDRVNKPWQIAYSSPSLAGNIAAVRAGLGVTVLPKNMIPEGVVPLGNQLRLPKLADSEIMMMRRENLPEAAKVLALHITRSLEQNMIHEKK